MDKERKDKSFIKKPIYLGGTKAYIAFIKDNLKYPQEALKNKIEGTVMLRYSINYKGEVTDAKILKGLGYGCDEEAKRIVKLLKFEIPKGPRKLKVLFHKDTKINFRLPKKKTVAPKKSISYTYTTAKKDSKQEQKPQKAKQSYSYTINW